MVDSILSIKNVAKEFNTGDKALKILDGINININRGESFSIVGPSGSGKTTLLGISAGLDNVSSGHVTLCGADLGTLDEDELAVLRRQKVGFIFQDFQLLPSLTALENVMVPLELQGKDSAAEKAKILLSKVGLKDRMDHYPAQLSGGEQQRVAMARAFSNDPEVLFADEPTGNLDEESGDLVVELLMDLNKDAGTTLIIVTHDQELAKKTQRMVVLKGGKVYQEL